MNSRNSGFTLIEIMIVIAVIAIISVIAFPSILNAKKSGNEASAQGSMRALTANLQQFRNRFSTFPATLPEVQTFGFVEGFIVNGSLLEKSGYSFSYARQSRETWTLNANPLLPGRSGDRTFFVDTSAVLRYENDGSPASISSPPLE